MNAIHRVTSQFRTQTIIIQRGVLALILAAMPAMAFAQTVSGGASIRNDGLAGRVAGSEASSGSYYWCQRLDYKLWRRYSLLGRVHHWPSNLFLARSSSPNIA